MIQYLLALAIIFCAQSSSAFKKVFLFSPPCSLSVAFTRMIEAHGSFKIIHEPSNCIEGQHHEETAKWFIPESLKSFEEVRALIDKEAESSHVFVKEMAHSAVKSFVCDTFDPELYTIFLLRNSHHQAISLYKKMKEVVNYRFSVYGYVATYELLEMIKQESSRKPLIIFSEDLYEHPQETAQKVCRYLGVEFKMRMLTWQDLGENFSGKDEWHEMKHLEVVQYWHKDAIRSTGFKKPTSYAIDDQGHPTFAEIEDAQHRELVAAACKENTKYYNLIKAGATHQEPMPKI